MAKDALRSRRDRIFQDKTNRNFGDGMAGTRCVDGQARGRMVSVEVSREPSSSEGEPYEGNAKVGISGAVGTRYCSGSIDKGSEDGGSVGSRRVDSNRYKQRWRGEARRGECRAMSERNARVTADKDTETSCWGWQSENLHHKYGAGRYHSSDAPRRHDVNRHRENEGAYRAKSAFLREGTEPQHARRERFYLREDENTSVFHGRRGKRYEDPYETRRRYRSSAWSPGRRAHWSRGGEREWDAGTGFLHFDRDRSNVLLADNNSNRGDIREALCYDYGQFGSLTDESMENWYNQDTPASKFEFIKRFLTTEKLKGIVDELESEFNSKATEVESLKGKHGDVSRSLENEKKKVSKLKELCRDRVLKERGIFQERIRELAEKIKKYKAYVEKMRGPT